MYPKVVDNSTVVGVDIARIVRRILLYLPPDILEGLQEVRVWDQNDAHPAFGCYRKHEGVIEIYVADLLGYLPEILLRLFYPFTYMVVGMVVGHELDHHVNRNNPEIDREESAETNMMGYVYPSLGIFKPAARIASFGGRALRRLREKKMKKTGAGNRCS